MEENYYGDDIAIVGYGCVLPKSGNVDEFKQLIYGNTTAIEQINPKRFINKKIYFDDHDKQSELKTYSDLAAEVDESLIDDVRHKYNLNHENYSRLDVMLISAFDQCISSINRNSFTKPFFSWGIMNLDEESHIHHFHKEKINLKKIISNQFHENEQKLILDIINEIDQKHFKNTNKLSINRIYASSIQDKVSKYFSLNGDYVFVDAACASSIASIDFAMKTLKNNKADIAFCGGLESNLSPGAYILFSRVGALSDNGPCLPFCVKSRGLVQGEGVVVYALKKLRKAVSDGDRILGIIRSIGSSSDGKSSSLFRPTLEGQMLCYKSAYKNLLSRRVDYIEAHGTGTTVGDKVELQSISDFFKDYSIPIGSVKSVIGHTKGCAGSSGLLKSLVIMQTRKIPSNKYFTKFPDDFVADIYINKTEEQIKERKMPIRIGVSSFGFGGANFHLVVDEYKEAIPIIERPLSSKNSEKPYTSNKNIKISDNNILILANMFFDISDVQELSLSSNYRVPPKSVPQIDELQMLAVYGVEKILNNASLQAALRNVPKEKVAVISVSSTGIDAFVSLIRKVYWQMKNEWVDRLTSLGLSTDVKEKFLKAVDEEVHKHAVLAEDSGPGILNNVIAGRVSNAFDFKHLNFNLDISPEVSLDHVIQKISAELLFEEKIVFLIHVHEKADSEAIEIHRNGLRIVLLANECLVKEYALTPIEKIHENVNDNVFQVKKYDGVDYGSWALCFHGQSTSYPGMFKKEYDLSVNFKKNFDIGDALFKESFQNKNFSISDFIFDPQNIDKEMLPMMQNLALFVSEISLAEDFIESKRSPKWITAHSFGEYAALVVSGIMSFNDAFRVVLHREKISRYSNKDGYLVAAVASYKDLEAIIAEEKKNGDSNKLIDMISNIHISNINSNNQTVMAISPQYVGDVVRFLKQKGIVAKVLDNVPCPYHSPLLNDLAARMKEFVMNEKFNYSKPVIDVFSSVLQKFITKDNFSKELVDKILSNQLISPVNYINQIESLHQSGCYNFCEIGPKEMLGTFIQDILNTKEFKNVFISKLLYFNDTENVKNIVLSDKQKGVLAILRNAIQKVAGYNINALSASDRFQEDLGIDSIKKAEIFFSVISELNLGNKTIESKEFVLNDLRSLADSAIAINNINEHFSSRGVVNDYINSEQLFTDITNDPVGLINNNVFNIFNKSLVSKKNSSNVKFGNPNCHGTSNVCYFDMASLLQMNVTSNTKDPYKFDSLIKFVKTIDLHDYVLVLHDSSNYILRSALSIAGESELTTNVFVNAVYELKNLFSFLFSTNDNVGVLYKIVLIGNEKNILIKSLTPFLKSVQLEHDTLIFRTILFDIVPNKIILQQIIQEEINQSIDLEIVYKNLNRFVFDYKNINMKDTDINVIRKQDHKKNSNRKKVIVVIGGAKGVGAEALIGLFTQSAENYNNCVVHIIGRSKEDDENVKIGLSSIQNVLNQINANGEKLHVSINYHSVDARLNTPFFNVLQMIIRVDGAINILINSAGVEYSSLLLKKTDEEIFNEIGTKFDICKNISNAVFDRLIIEKIYIFSSVVSDFGNHGQSVYALSNCIVNEYCEQVNFELAKQKIDSSFYVIHWPAWESVGMTSSVGMNYMLRQKQISLLNKEKGRELFDMIVSNSEIYSNNGNFNVIVTTLYELIVANGGNVLKGMQNTRDVCRNSSEFSDNMVNDNLLMLGKLDKLRPLVFSYNYSIKNNPIFLSHKMRDLILVPASFVTAQVFLLTNIISKNNISINYQSNSLCIIDTNLVASIVLSKVDEQKTTFEFNSSVNHFKFEVGPVSNVEVFFNKTMFENVLLRSYDRFVGDSKYVYTENGINFGHDFQLLSTIFYDENYSMKVLARNMLEYNVYGKFFGILLKILEGSIQAVAARIIFDLEFVTVPISFSRLLVNHELLQSLNFDSDIYFYPEIISHDNKLNISSGRVIATDNFNNIIITIDILKMSKIKEAQGVSFKMITNKKNN